MKHTEKIILQPNNELKNSTLLLLSIPETIALKWKLSGPSLLFRCGALEKVVEVQVYRTSSSHTVYCSPALLTSLSLPNQTIPITLTFFDKLNMLSLGPILCLATNAKGSELEPFGAYTSFCREVAEYCEEHHILFYVYTLKPWNEQRVKGMIWNQRTWVDSDLPKPSLIYNRIHSRKLEKSSHIEMLKTIWREQNIPYFNESFLNKWEVHQKLLPYDEVAPYLPETILLESFDNIQSMMSNYPTVYLKPLNGSQGKHIFRISYQDQLFQLDYSSYQGNQTITSKTLSGLYPTIRARSKLVPYLVQQGIPLIEIEGCPVDFRILCLKDSGERWKVISAVARIAQSKEQFVSNIARGALLKKFEEGLIHFDEAIKKQTKRIVPELACEISQIIDRESDGMFGELGIDLSVDQKGHPWIIEVNTKPSKTSDGSNPNRYRPSVKALIRFFKWYTS
ncbi:YheC/YheD family protein [Guptibacillus hwajinpoensis]|uniref:YheC/YheD family endospore coat-associated protein n=1 Tax=Guptibacillus hwajinpoensis TaxID=208199 RepID=UPI00373591A0